MGSHRSLQIDQKLREQITALRCLKPDDRIGFSALADAVGIQIIDVPRYLGIREIEHDGDTVRAGDLPRYL